MKTASRISSRASVILAIYIVFAPFVIRAQSAKCAPTLSQALWQPYESPPIVTVLISDPIPPEQPGAKWTIYDTTEGTSISVNVSTYTPVKGSNPAYGGSANIVPQRPLQIDHVYYLVVNGLVFLDCQGAPKSLAPVVVQTKRPKDASKDFVFSVAKGREDSDFYFAPTIDGASGTKASYTLDTKFQFRKSLLPAQFGSNVAYHPAIYFIPGWDVKISSNPKEDGNSVNFVVPLEIVAPVSPNKFPLLSRFVPAVISQLGFVAEADKKFHDVNGIFSDAEYFVLRSFGGELLSVIPEPVVGVETGSNLKAQSAGTYPESILRADVGLHLGMNLFQGATKKKPLFSIEADYMRRLLLHPEPIYTVNSTGGYVLQSVGTQPRDHVTVKINYNLTSYVAFTAAYEYGSLPPLYTKVDNKYTFGVTLQGQLQYRPGAAK
jgi:hypothetical protein